MRERRDQALAALFAAGAGAYMVGWILVSPAWGLVAIGATWCLLALAAHFWG